MVRNFLHIRIIRMKDHGIGWCLLLVFFTSIYNYNARLHVSCQGDLTTLKNLTRLWRVAFFKSTCPHVGYSWMSWWLFKVHPILVTLHHFGTKKKNSKRLLVEWKKSTFGPWGYSKLVPISFWCYQRAIKKCGCLIFNQKIVSSVFGGRHPFLFATAILHRFPSSNAEMDVCRP